MSRPDGVRKQYGSCGRRMLTDMRQPSMKHFNLLMAFLILSLILAGFPAFA
jgi:hypothetical protein